MRSSSGLGEAAREAGPAALGFKAALGALFLVRLHPRAQDSYCAVARQGGSECQ